MASAHLGSVDTRIPRPAARNRRFWRKLHIDTNTGHITAATPITSDVDDASEISPLLDPVDTPVESFTADGSSDQDRVYSEVVSRHPLVSVIVSEGNKCSMH